jgi:hypothetical protein
MSARRTVRGHGKPAGHSAVGAEAGTRGSCLGQRRVAASDWGVWRLPARVRMWGASSGPVQGHVVPSYKPTNFSWLVRLGWLLVRSGFPFLTVFQVRFRHLGCVFLLVLDAHRLRCRARHCSRTNHPWGGRFGPWNEGEVLHFSMFPPL